MNRTLQAISHGLGQRVYPEVRDMSCVHVTDNVSEMDTFTRSRMVKSRAVIEINTIAPDSGIQQAREQNFKAIQDMLYGELRKELHVLEYESRRRDLGMDKQLRYMLKLTEA